MSGKTDVVTSLKSSIVLEQAHLKDAALLQPLLLLKTSYSMMCRGASVSTIP